MTFDTTLPPPITPDLALFLDFDGTLAPIQDDPASIYLSGRQQACIVSLSETLDSALAIVSGRDIRDLSKRVPNSVWRAGSHGLEICAPGDAALHVPKAAPPGLESSLQAITTSYPGSRLEVKGEVMAIHYRFAPREGASIQGEMANVLNAYPGYTLQSGKYVLEAKPAGANKGAALDSFMGLSAFMGRVPVMVGDDTTDEDAMSVVAARGGWAIKVGEGETGARYRLSEPDDVWRWLSKGTL